jgi:signal peptidase I
MFKLLKVSGDSLRPAYQDGDFVLVSKIPYLFAPAKPKDVIAFRHPLYGTMIKMVGHLTADGKEIHVIGIHDRSVDSREFGVVSPKDIVGKVIWHIKRREQTQGGEHHE